MDDESKLKIEEVVQQNVPMWTNPDVGRDTIEIVTSNILPNGDKILEKYPYEYEIKFKRIMNTNTFQIVKEC